MVINTNNNDLLDNTLHSNSLLSNLNSVNSKKTQINNGTIYAGNLNSISNTNQSPLDEIKDKFKKQAQQVIAKQLEKEMDFQNNLKEIENQITELESDLETQEESKQTMQAEKQNLMDSYGITADSTEEKELQLIKKAKYHSESLSEEEQQQLNEMGELTDYQKQALSIDEGISSISDKIKKIQNQIYSIRVAIIDIKIDKMKSHPMEDAQRVAKELLEEGNKQLLKEASKEAIATINDSLTPDEETTDPTEATKDEDSTESEENETQDLAKQVNTENQLGTSKIDEVEKITRNLKMQLLTMADQNHLTPDETLGIIVDTLL